MSLPQHLRIFDRSVKLSEVKRLYESYQAEMNPLVYSDTLVHPEDQEIEEAPYVMIRSYDKFNPPDDLEAVTKRSLCFAHHIFDILATRREYQSAARKPLKKKTKQELYDAKAEFMRLYPFHRAMSQSMLWDEALAYVVDYRHVNRL